MAFRIIHIVSSEAEKRLEVPSGLLRIGRGALNDLQLDNLAIPLNQAEIKRNEEGLYVLREVSQAHIVYLNGVPVKEAILQSGDVIKIENYRLSVSQGDPSTPLVLSVQEEASPSSERSFALMPKLLLGGGRWTKWRLAVSLVVVLSIVWALAGAWSQGRVLMPGALSVKHAKFEAECDKCHASVKPVWKVVDNAACQVCHNTEILSPTHFKDGVTMSDVPACVSCHLEHKGTHALADISDGKCVQCHGDLQAKEPTVGDLAAVHNFSTDHPEFAITQSRPDGQGEIRVRLSDTERLKDGGRLKLNHSLHLKLGDKYLESINRESLTCPDCHHMDDEGRFIQPISFQRDCFSCHSNDIDLAPVKPGRQVTHGRQLDKLRQQLDDIFSGEYIQAHPEEAKKPDSLRWIPGRRLPGQLVTPHERYVVDRRAEAERVLLSAKSRRCLKCHDVEDGMEDVAATIDGEGTSSPSVEGTGLQGEALSADSGVRAAVTLLMSVATGKAKKIVGVNIPVRWLPYNRFDHRAHAAIPEIKAKGEGNWCVPCHENAARSVRSDDVLLPSISLCRTCHFDPGGAQASCRSCHEFHVPHKPGERPLTSFHSRPARQLSSHVEEFRYV